LGGGEFIKFHGG
jgi:hypothetical protein